MLIKLFREYTGNINVIQHLEKNTTMINTNKYTENCFHMKLILYVNIEENKFIKLKIKGESKR